MIDPIHHGPTDGLFTYRNGRLYVVLGLILVGAACAAWWSHSAATPVVAEADATEVAAESAPPPPEIDKIEYDRRLDALAHDPETAVVEEPAVEDSEIPEPEPRSWPVEAVYPQYGAILPFHRIVAYYGNFYSTGMGVLGEFAQETVLEKLAAELQKWKEADPDTPVLPAIDYIAVTAQAGGGKDGMYRLRMPPDQIEKALAMAAEVDGIVVLEVQPGFAPLMDEILALEPFLSMPNVHLAIDPEFVMIERGVPPGVAVGTVDATDVNAAAEYLASLVREHGLPPKVLVVHRYTRPMVTNAADIVPLPEVQIVIDMDGWGPPDKKIDSYESYVASEPVQFTGFKLFYKNDLRREGSRMMTPEEILGLTPAPIFIQYQ